MSKLIAAVLASAFLVGTASAQTPPAADPPAASKPNPAASGAAAEVKTAKGVSNREPVEPGAEFEAGTTVWAWSLVTGAQGTTIKHVWKKDGAEQWHATLKVGSKKWTTYSRRTLKKAGSYAVEVVAEDGSVLGTAEFTVK